jgi:hypothetical protein
MGMVKGNMGREAVVGQQEITAIGIDFSPIPVFFVLIKIVRANNGHPGETGDAEKGWRNRGRLGGKRRKVQRNRFPRPGEFEMAALNPCKNGWPFL